ncbi:MAG: formylglycine-generating enzyme family protein [Bacteroidia bacterium]|nr:formylglycine-generating enzyme family protein [Bacteroidia bacterium]
MISVTYYITTSAGPVSVDSFKKSLFDQYNLIGNVSEMLDEKNTARGGSWLHLPEEARVGKAQHYSGPAKWLGFRCVCIVNNLSQ